MPNIKYHDAVYPPCRRQQMERRHPVNRALSRYGLVGRRKLIRRRLDALDIQTDVFEPHIMAVCLSVVFLGLCDMWLTTLILGRGGIELNFLMAHVMELGFYHFFFIKYSLTALSLILLVAYQQHIFFVVRVKTLLYMVFAGYAGLIVYEVFLLDILP